MDLEITLDGPVNSTVSEFMCKVCLDPLKSPILLEIDEIAAEVIVLDCICIFLHTIMKPERYTNMLEYSSGG